MPIFNIFSKRMKAEKCEIPDVYQYDNFPNSLRVKVIYILQDIFEFYPVSEQLSTQVIKILCREYGKFQLEDNTSRSSYDDPFDEDKMGKTLFNYFLKEQDTERALNVVELCFQILESYFEGYNNPDWAQLLSSAIIELNDRFKEEGFGYRYESGIIIRVTDEYTHNEIVKPALKVLSDKRFAGAQQEFLSAHKHFREHESKECIVDCLKSFESTMKVICKTKKYKVDAAAPANKLITALSENNYMPNYLDSQFNALKQLLSCGIPTIRNNLAGHGQGEVIKDVDDNYAGYALNITAANIVFLVSLLKDNK